MARNEQDREDLLREATALVERIELTVVGWSEPIVVGFRRSGAASSYFGADPVYQFNERNELRRGYLDGRLLKAESGRLVWLDRHRTPTAVELRREVFTDEARQAYLAQARRDLMVLRDRLAAGDFTVVGQVPGNGDVLARVRRWLDSLPEPLVAAQAANVTSPS